MPSIYNHENSCWGVKRPFCNVFQYDFSEELHMRKLTQLQNVEGSPPSTDNLSLAEINASVHYSVSSSGYYGFQPHSIINDKTNDGMDVDEDCINSINEPVRNTNTMDSQVLPSNFQNPRRKRHMAVDCVHSFKRMRHEGPNMAEPNTSDQGSHQCGGDSSVKHRRHWSSRVDLLEVGYETTTTQLLRQTHGCELYLYERSSDY